MLKKNSVKVLFDGMEFLASRIYTYALYSLRITLYIKWIFQFFLSKKKKQKMLRCCTYYIKTFFRTTQVEKNQIFDDFKVAFNYLNQSRLQVNGRNVTETVICHFLWVSYLENCQKYSNQLVSKWRLLQENGRQIRFLHAKIS